MIGQDEQDLFIFSRDREALSDRLIRFIGEAGQKLAENPGKRSFHKNIFFMNKKYHSSVLWNFDEKLLNNS